MATIDLGKIKLVWKGTYNNATAYTVDDLVEYTDTGITSTYICVANSTGNAPSSGGSAHASWNYLAKGVADPIPTQSGNSGKFLKTNGSALSFDNVTQAIKSVHSKSDGTRASISTFVSDNSYTSATDWTNLTITITPASASSKFHITGTLQLTRASSYEGHILISYTPTGGTETFLLSGGSSPFRRTHRANQSTANGDTMQTPTSLDLDVEPNTTAAIAFRIRLCVSNSGYPWYLNRNQVNSTNVNDGGDVLSNWTITELDGSLVTVSRTASGTYT